MLKSLLEFYIRRFIYIAAGLAVLYAVFIIFGPVLSITHGYKQKGKESIYSRPGGDIKPVVTVAEELRPKAGKVSGAHMEIAAEERGLHNRRRYTDRGFAEPVLEGFYIPWIFRTGRYFQEGRDKYGGYWRFRGGVYKAFYDNKNIREMRFYERTIRAGVYEKYEPNNVWKYYSEAGRLYREDVYMEGEKRMEIHYDTKGGILSKNKY